MMPHAKAASKLFTKITKAAGTGDILTADGLAERLIAFGVPEERSWRLFDLLDTDDADEVTMDEFVLGFSHYTALVNEFTAEDGGTTDLDIHQLPLECMTIVLSFLSAQPAELAAVAATSARLRTATAADGVWAPMFRRRSWTAPVHCQLSTQLEKMQGDEAEWNTVVKALPQAVREQVSRWRSWRECYRAALRQESWVVVELAATELRIGSVADTSPAVFPLQYPLVCGSTAGAPGSRMASGTILADLICDAQPKLDMSAEGASLCVVASPLCAPKMLAELAEALACRKVHRLQFINLTVAALECARMSARGDVVGGVAGNLLQSDEPPPPSGIVVVISDEGCFTAAVAHGHQLYIPTPSPALAKNPTDLASKQTADAAAPAASFLPQITCTSSRDMAQVEGARSPMPRSGSGATAIRDSIVSKPQQQTKEFWEQHRAAASVAVPGTLSLYGCAALAQDLAVAVAATGQVAGDQSQSVEDTKLQASDILLAIRPQVTSICYVRTCPASARPVSQEERLLCRAAYEIQLTVPKVLNFGNGGGGASGDRGSSSTTGVQWPAQRQPMGAAAASALVRQARMQQLIRANVVASASTTTHDGRVEMVAYRSGGTDNGSSKRCGIARFTNNNALGLASLNGADGAGEAGIVVVMVKPTPTATPLAKCKTALPGQQQQQQQQTCPSMVVELGEDRFTLTEALLYGRSHTRSHRQRHAGPPVQTGAAGVIGALCSLAEAIFGAGGTGRSLHSSDQLAALASARQFVLAGEGALLQGLCSRIGWELRQRDAARTTPLGQMLRSAKMVAVTHPRPQTGRHWTCQQTADGPGCDSGEPGGQATRNATPAAEQAATRQHHASPRSSAQSATKGSAQEARAVGWYGGKIHVLRVERTGGFVRSGAGGSADAMRMASGRAWLTLTAGSAEIGSAGDGGSRRLLQPNKLADQLKLHLRHRAGFPLPPSSHF
jgi:hypothetical protein